MAGPGADRVGEYFGSGSCGSKNVAAAGTPEPLVAVETPCAGVRLFPKPGNAGGVVPGIGSEVSAVSGSEAGWAYLAPGSVGVFIPCSDASQIYLDVTVSGEGVGYNIVQY